MSNCKAKLKRGMKGSNGGRGRWAYTEILKKDSKHSRRIEDTYECATQLAEMTNIPSKDIHENNNLPQKEKQDSQKSNGTNLST